MNEKNDDTKKLLSNIPDENCLPHHRSELRRLYKRLEKRLYGGFGFVVKEKTQPATSKLGQVEDDEREILKKKCRYLIRTLKTCIRLHGTKAASNDD
ncbi:MAG: hypothetical protein P4L61_01940 [Candidatus Pacebacteria bacterium]|nr:hypothetical protein [Candidatus Paceibacterota bacterium]